MKSDPTRKQKAITMPKLVRRNAFRIAPKPTKQRATRRRRTGFSGGFPANKHGAMYNPNLGLLQPFVAFNPFKPGERHTIKYAEPFSMSTGSNVFGSQQVMRLNSIYDPNSTGGGHVPYAYAEFAARYKKYRVDSVIWRITLTTPGGANDQYIAATVAPNTSGAIGGATLYNPLEDPSCVYGLMSSEGDRRAVIGMMMQLHKVCGVDRTKYQSDDTYSANITANPAQDCILSFATCASDGTGSLSSQALVEIWYNVWFYDRITTN